MSADNVRAVRMSYEAVGRGDSAALDAFGSDMRFVAPASLPWGGTYNGPEGMGRLFTALVEHWDDLRLEIEQLLDAGDDVIVMGRLQGISRQTTRRIDLPYLEVLTLRDGKIVAGRIEMDTAKALDALRVT
jgi:ketosteroid isomerase-like protein